MKIWVLTLLFVLNFTSLRGAKMPRNNILGLHFDILKREANVVLGRKQAIFEVVGSDTGIGPATLTRTLPDDAAGAKWTLEDGHLSELESMRPMFVENRWVARPTGGRPLRYHFLEPMVLQPTQELPAFAPAEQNVKK